MEAKHVFVECWLSHFCLSKSSAVSRVLFDDHWQDQVDRQLSAAAVAGRYTLPRACRHDTTGPDPILYLPIGLSARSRPVRWRLGRFTNMREECPCDSGDISLVIISCTVVLLSLI